MSKEKSEKEKNKKEEKEEQEDSEEESGLEEEIENTEEKIDTKQFQNFMQRDFQIIPQEIEIENTGFPSLEKINPAQRDTFVRLEQGIGGSFENNKKDEDNSFKYSVGAGGNSEEPKYTKTYGEEVNTVTQTDITTLGRNNPFSERPEVARMTYEDEIKSVNQEKYNPVKMQDIQKLGKENPNEKKLVKYTPSGK